MIGKKKIQRDLYRLCNASFFRESTSTTNALARLKITLGVSYDNYTAIPLHKRITMRGSQYVKELDCEWTQFERQYLLRFVIDCDKFRIQKLRMINKDF